MSKTHKEWERPLKELEDALLKLKELNRREQDPATKERRESQISGFEARRDRYVEVMYANLGPWDKVLVARADNRPYTLDYVQAICHNFVELQGDRNGFTDHAIVGGPAMIDGRPVMVVGHQKGRSIQERQLRNFGYARPEGYRKAIRLFEMAERFRLPVITFIDTPGADAGVEAESRGISEAIAASIFKMFELTVPSISVIIGEGGSGGAIGIAASNKVLMLEHSIYSVIAPEGCASILWRQADRGADAAKALKLTAQCALDFDLIDAIIPEPKGGAHRDWPTICANVKAEILSHLAELDTKSPATINQDRYDRFRRMGVFNDGLQP